MFGTKQLGAIHGYILTAWSMAGIVGPLAVARINEATGSYTNAFYLFSGLLFFAVILSFAIKKNINTTKRKKTENKKKQVIAS